jgi:DNA-binding winged helix-turn-helix (wHTH) protein
VRRVPDDPSDPVVAAAFSPEWLDHHADAPVIDDDGLLRFGGRWVALSPVQTRVAGVLLDRFDDGVATYDELRVAAWGTTSRSPHALATLVKRLRRRIDPIGLGVITVRRHGYQLEVRRPAA